MDRPGVVPEIASKMIAECTGQSFFARAMRCVAAGRDIEEDLDCVLCVGVG
jgi:hypothetical protein